MMLILSISTAVMAAVSALIAIVLVTRIIIHVTRGETKELRRFAWAFGILVPFLLLEFLNSLPVIHSGATSLLFAPFGVAWIAEQCLFAISAIVLIHWTWQYLKMRPLPQLYVSLTAIGLCSFVISTIIFTVVLLKSSETQALASIEADAKTFSLALTELGQRTAFAAAAISARPSLVEAAQNNDREAALTALGNPVADYSVSAAYILNASGELIVTQGAEAIFGQSFANDPTTKKTLTGAIISSPTLLEGSDAPSLIIRGGSPLVSEGDVVGAVLVDTPLDTAFVDRVGSVTGLDVTIFAQQYRAATNLRDHNGRPLVPAKIEDQTVSSTVLNQGKMFRDASTVNSNPYVIAAIPITTIENTRIGILSAGLPVQTLVDGLKASTRISFIGSFVLMLLALPVFYFVARMLVRQTDSE